jgi:hypothetical protein
MTITDVSIGVRNKNPKGRVTGYSGVCIAFNSSKNIKDGSFIRLEEPKASFQVHAININEDKTLDVEAHEVSYRKLDKIENFDIRSLLGLEVSEVTDPEAISKIREEMSWC